jgi:hypothetical protein
VWPEDIVAGCVRLEDIAANYKKVAGFQVEALNARPSIVPVPPIG